MTTAIDDDRYVTACHEAGHAVATLLCGGHIATITIEATVDYRGRTEGLCPSFDSMFVIYAGPWAEARAQWTESMLDEDQVDDEGCAFGDRVTRAFRNYVDGDDVEYRRALETDPLEMARHAEDLRTPKVVRPEIPEIGDREKLWSRELETAWPVIETIADRLLTGPVSGEDVTDLVRDVRRRSSTSRNNSVDQWDSPTDPSRFCRRWRHRGDGLGNAGRSTNGRGRAARPT